MVAIQCVYNKKKQTSNSMRHNVGGAELGPALFKEAWCEPLCLSHTSEQ